MSSSRDSRVAMSPIVVVAALTLLLGIQPVATDLYLPSLPSIVSGLDTTIRSAQLTLSVVIICFGVAQLVCGPLSDRFGRRPVLLGGLALFTAASVGCALAPGIEWLIAMRALMGAAMAAAVTCGRSLVRDLFEPQQGTRVMARGLTGLGSLAAISPLVGSVLVSWLGWRAALSATAVFGVCALLFCGLKFQETLPRKDLDALRLRPLALTWKRIVANRTFIAYTALAASSYGAMFTILVTSSFVYMQVLGLSRLQYGLLMAFSSCTYMCGTVLCRSLLTRYGLRRTVALGGSVSGLAGVLMASLSLLGVGGLWAVALPQWLFTIGHGITQPCGQAGAVGPFPEAAGSAAALSGFFMMLMAFATGLLLAEFGHDTVFPLTLGCAVFTLMVCAVAWTLVQRHGEPRASTVVVPEPA